MKMTTAYACDENNFVLIPTVSIYRAHCGDPDCDTTHGIDVHFLVFCFAFSLIFTFHE